jgi:hypothetical protein
MGVFPFFMAGTIPPTALQISYRWEKRMEKARGKMPTAEGEKILFSGHLPQK